VKAPGTPLDQNREERWLRFEIRRDFVEHASRGSHWHVVHSDQLVQFLTTLIPQSKRSPDVPVWLSSLRPIPQVEGRVGRPAELLRSACGRRTSKSLQLVGSQSLSKFHSRVLRSSLKRQALRICHTNMLRGEGTVFSWGGLSAMRSSCFIQF
jgi:hypothetical protein